MPSPARSMGWHELGLWDDENRFIVEPGEFVLTITDGTESERLELTVAV